MDNESMSVSKNGNILIQCDFDGTVTEEDISFLILDAFADGDWGKLLDQYKEDKISVGSFNTKAFVMVKEGEETLKKFIRKNFEIRDAFRDMVDYCQNKGFRLVIVSNGMEFYIKTILEEIGVGGIEVIAANACFGGDGIEASYISPRGEKLQDGFKEAYIRSFLDEGYRIIYIGNGVSDIPSAGLASHVFATGQLLEYYREENLEHTPFNDFTDVLKGLEALLG